MRPRHFRHYTWSRSLARASQFVEQRLGVFQVGGVEALGEPAVLFNREGDCLAAKLRPGNVSSAEGWEELLLPEIERQQLLGKEVVFRADAAFAKPELYEALEEREVKYAIRLPAIITLAKES